MQTLLSLCAAALLSLSMPLTPQSPQAAPWPIVLRATHVTPQGMTLVCSSGSAPSAEVLETGSAFTLEQWDGRQWVSTQLQFPTRSFYWTDEAWLIPPGETVYWNIDWGQLYGSLSPGLWRIGKTITGSSQNPMPSAAYHALFFIS